MDIVTLTLANVPMRLIERLRKLYIAVCIKKLLSLNLENGQLYPAAGGMVVGMPAGSPVLPPQSMSFDEFVIGYIIANSYGDTAMVDQAITQAERQEDERMIRSIMERNKVSITVASAIEPPDNAALNPIPEETEQIEEIGQ